MPATQILLGVIDCNVMVLTFGRRHKMLRGLGRSDVEQSLQRIKFVQGFWKAKIYWSFAGLTASSIPVDGSCMDLDEPCQQDPLGMPLRGRSAHSINRVLKQFLSGYAPGVFSWQKESSTKSYAGYVLVEASIKTWSI